MASCKRNRKTSKDKIHKGKRGRKRKEFGKKPAIPKTTLRRRTNSFPRKRNGFSTLSLAKQTWWTVLSLVPSIPDIYVQNLGRHLVCTILPKIEGHQLEKGNWNPLRTVQLWNHKMVVPGYWKKQHEQRITVFYVKRIFEVRTIQAEKMSSTL